MLIPFKYSPYPLTNKKDAKKFFDVKNEDGRRAHNSPRGGTLWEDTTYSDNRVLISIPANFDKKRTPTIVIFLHGNQSTLARDVIARQKIPEQIAAANINAILIAPQFAVDALDSNSGNFARRNYFSRFITEASLRISHWQNSYQLKSQLEKAPIIIVSYSGGYLATAHILSKGSVSTRIKGVILMDSLYGQEDVFAKWLKQHHKNTFFFSTYSEPARATNEQLQYLLREKNLPTDTNIPEFLRKNTISFFKLDENIKHEDLLTNAWTEEPVADLLRKINMNKK